MGESKERGIDSRQFGRSFEQWKRQSGLGPEASLPVQTEITGTEKLPGAGTVKMTPPEPPGQPIVPMIELVIPPMGGLRRTKSLPSSQPATPQADKASQTAKTTLPHDILGPVRGFLRKISWPARIFAGVATASVPVAARAAGPAAEPGSESAIAEAAAKAFANQTRQVQIIPLDQTNIDLNLAGITSPEQLFDLQQAENLAEAFGKKFFEENKEFLASVGLDTKLPTDFTFEIVKVGETLAVQRYTSGDKIYEMVWLSQGGEENPGLKALFFKDLTEKGVILAQVADAFDENGALTPQAAEKVNSSGILPADLSSSGDIVGVGRYTQSAEPVLSNDKLAQFTQGVGGLRLYFDQKHFPRAKIAQPETAEMSNNITASLHTKETAPTGKFVQSLNVRKGPGTDYERVGSIKQADVVEVLGRDEQTGWGKVKLADGTIGFVNLSYLGLAEGTQLPTISPEEIAAIAKVQPEAAPEAPKEQQAETQQPQLEQPEISSEYGGDFETAYKQWETYILSHEFGGYGNENPVNFEGLGAKNNREAVKMILAILKEPISHLRPEIQKEVFKIEGFALARPGERGSSLDAVASVLVNRETGEVYHTVCFKKDAFVSAASDKIIAAKLAVLAASEVAHIKANTRHNSEESMIWARNAAEDVADWAGGKDIVAWAAQLTS